MLSLETCLKLKEAGWEQDSGNSYVDGELMDEGSINHSQCEFSHRFNPKEFVACPSLEELLEAVLSRDDVYEVEVHKAKGQSWAIVTMKDGSVWSTATELTLPDSPSEAVAMLLLKLKERS